MKIGIISDLHLFNKVRSIERAASKLNDIDLLLIVGDIADRADEKQYGLFLDLFDEKFHDIPAYSVFGNHDNPARDDTNYRAFERKLNSDYPAILDVCGAFYKCIHENIDLIGLNPLYHQKQFFFPDKGQQIDFLKRRFEASLCRYHIVMCHPPLIAHNPQRTADMGSYIAADQDKRLQTIIDETQNVIFLSGHTHVSPVIEFDETHGNLYINDGSICPTTRKGTEAVTQQGNVTLLEITETDLTVTIKGIYSEKILEEFRIQPERRNR